MIVKGIFGELFVFNLSFSISNDEMIHFFEGFISISLSQVVDEDNTSLRLRKQKSYAFCLARFNDDMIKSWAGYSWVF